MLRIALFLLFSLIVFPPVSHAENPGAPLSWAPPPLENPARITVRDAQDGMIDIEKSVYPYGTVSSSHIAAGSNVLIKLGDHEDAIITLPLDRILDVSGLSIAYGRHVRIIGGHLRATRPADKSLRALLRFAGQSGSVFVEGMVIDANGQYGLDGLDVGGVAHRPGVIADVYVQNCLIKGVFSGRAGLHADGFQYYGPTGWTRMDRVSVVSQYQGLFLDPQNDMEGVDLRRVDVRYADPATGAGYIFFLRTEKGRDRHPPVRLHEVYADARTNVLPWQEYSIYPPASRATGAVLNNGKACFPAYPEVQGCVGKGRPPTGSFVTEKNAGLHYISPGYR